MLCIVSKTSTLKEISSLEKFVEEKILEEILKMKKSKHIKTIVNNKKFQLFILQHKNSEKETASHFPLFSQVYQKKKSFTTLP